MSQDSVPAGHRRLSAKQWTAIVLGIIALIFILQNLNYVRVELLIFHTSAPLWAILSITLFIGYLIGRFSKKRD
ncbi:hypothetical protein ACTXJX_08975 [Glutamicibacter ardleyensis]|uniref:hypothetical protein n=1 Tax=Glutamicibacter ardleyensis TaxID=225894 RepID=UPI003F9BFECC